MAASLGDKAALPRPGPELRTQAAPRLRAPKTRAAHTSARASGLGVRGFGVSVTVKQGKDKLRTRLSGPRLPLDGAFRRDRRGRAGTTLLVVVSHLRLRTPHSQPRPVQGGHCGSRSRESQQVPRELWLPSLSEKRSHVCPRALCPVSLRLPVSQRPTS